MEQKTTRNNGHQETQSFFGDFLYHRLVFIKCACAHFFLQIYIYHQRKIVSLLQHNRQFSFSSSHYNQTFPLLRPAKRRIQRVLSVCCVFGTCFLISTVYSNILEYILCISIFHIPLEFSFEKHIMFSWFDPPFRDTN